MAHYQFDTRPIEHVNESSRLRDTNPVTDPYTMVSEVTGDEKNEKDGSRGGGVGV
jgi:hypothetical protein